jgi:hypothetical protein
MIVKDGDRFITLEELAKLLCGKLDCFEDGCPAAAHCRHGHNGMIDWLRKLINGESED